MIRMLVLLRRHLMLAKTRVSRDRREKYMTYVKFSYTPSGRKEIYRTIQRQL